MNKKYLQSLEINPIDNFSSFNQRFVKLQLRELKLLLQETATVINQIEYGLSRQLVLKLLKLFDLIEFLLREIKPLRQEIATAINQREDGWCEQSGEDDDEWSCSNDEGLL